VDRFFIDAYGPDADAERGGVAWLAREAARRGTSGAIVVPGLDSIRNLGRAIGPQAAAVAAKNRYFTIEGTRIEVFSDRTKPHRFDGPVLVPWSNDAMVNAAEEMDPPAICGIPWGEGDLAEWKRAWNPIDPRTGEPVGEGPASVSSELVERALFSLTRTVNMSTGIHHPSDERQAKQLLKALYLCGEPLDEMEIRTWAISHAWQPRHAENLAELAGKIAAGRRVKGAAMNKTEAKQIVGRLRDLAE
jgi:hypothetical protein